MAELVDLNTATAKDLAALPGVEPALAESIIAYREAHGFFEAVEELMRVPGMSPSSFARLEQLVTVKTSSGPAPGSAPPPEPLDVQLVQAGGGGDFTGYSVVVVGVRRTGDEGSEGVASVPFAASGSTGADGLAALSIPARQSIVGDVTLRASAPDGELLVSTTQPGPGLPRTVTLTVTAREPGTTQANTDPTAGMPTRLRGRVIDSAGRRQAAGVQVVLWGAEAAQPQPVDFRALIVATTDAQGHFSGPYPVGYFTSAHATVGLADGPADVPVHLLAPTVETEAGPEERGIFPETAVLVVDVPEPAAEEDCACHDTDSAPRSPDATDLARADGTFSTDAGVGRCVDFTKPDRTLEEYSFSYLVRTTEPEIKGLSLDEPPKVPVRLLTPYLVAELAQSRAEFRNAPGAEAAADVSARRAVDKGAETSDRTGEGEAVDEPTLPAAGYIDAAVLKSLARDPDASTLKAVYAAAQQTRHGDLLRYLGEVEAKPPGRQQLTGAHPVDWDDDPTVYQASTIAHGHILRFKQEWVADGYSMGNLLYSLPLAPGQKKQIAVLDWERRETTARAESGESRDSLEANLTRDRDITEIVTGTLAESTRGGSRSSSGSIAAGGGVAAISGAVGGLLGVGGGYASAQSTAWQDSSRSTAANALNQLRDRTVQAASSVRTQRTSVVHTVAQGERVVATTESVANYNHCHALTIQYFEVLRHLLVRERLVDVQECLLVPLLMSWFTDAKALRWRNTLADAVPPALRAGFDALERIDAHYAGSDLPVGRYADENLESVEGELNLTFQLARPRDTDDDFDPAQWNPLLGLFGFTPKDFYDQYLRDQNFKDRVFLEQLGPKIAATVVQHLRVHAVKNDESTVDLAIDPTLVSRFANDRSLFVSLRMAASLPPVHRADIKAVVISSKLALPGLPFVIDLLPYGSRVIIDSGELRYRTGHLSSRLFSSSSIRNDLTGYDEVRIETPLNRQELRNPREEDKELARNLLDHLNENIEGYHHLLWARMSDARRFMLLDGFVAPNAGGRSVASVVENELIGIVGNSLVLPVARGFHLDPTYRQDTEHPVDLLDHYQPNTPVEPSRIAVPTSGVYAEAAMGACNSCEQIDETRFWRWEESPIPDSPPQILPTSTDTRRAAPADVTPTPFQQPIIAMQNAPAAPDPTGLGAALTLLGQSGSFRDMAGLEGTQKNAAAALQEAFTTATAFGTKAADLALQGKMSKDIDKAIKTIETAKSKGLIDDAKASELTSTAIRGMVGAGATNPESATSAKEVKELTETAGANNAAVRVTQPTGEKVDIDARPVMPASSPAREPLVKITLPKGKQSLDPLGTLPPLEVQLTIPDLSKIRADRAVLELDDGTPTLVAEEVLPPSFLTAGTHVWRWNGRDKAGVFDPEVFRRPLRLTVRFEGAGLVSVEKAVHLKTARRSWVAAKVNSATKQIALDVYVANSPAGGITPSEFHRLAPLVLSGLGKYWSRSVTPGSDTFVVTTTARQSLADGVALNLIVETDSEYRRSHNSGIIDARIYYNEGFYGGPGTAADEDFEHTAAHEFGHTVLEAAGGRDLSWSHKGTVYGSPLDLWDFQKPSPNATVYPTSGEIDLMKYYKGSEPSDLYARTHAAQEDVLRLIALADIQISL
ncbi:helix-hairpin-helix domain-containing protein [Streptomyces sp. NBC_00648]|uniref:helix-hairpin-helix domain-containing protein n=1 Tax=Streptomyces sp. NBC_00648 TaxID=2975797 RepID=UPI0032517987